MQRHLGRGRPMPLSGTESGRGGGHLRGFWGFDRFGDDLDGDHLDQRGNGGEDGPVDEARLEGDTDEVSLHRQKVHGKSLEIGHGGDPRSEAFDGEAGAVGFEPGGEDL